MKVIEVNKKKIRNNGSAYIFVLVLMLSLFTMLSFFLRITTQHAILQIDRDPSIRVLAQSGIDIGFYKIHFTNDLGVVYEREDGELIVSFGMDNNGDYRMVSIASHIEIHAILEREGYSFNIIRIYELFD